MLSFPEQAIEESSVIVRVNLSELTLKNTYIFVY